MAGLWAWKRELQLEGIGSFQELTGSKKERLEALRETYVWNLVNYEGLLACPQILEVPWNAIVLDECRRISNPKAKTTKALQTWSRGNPTTKKMILSGNPAPESPLEYFEQMRFLYGKFMHCNNYWQFRQAYFRELAPHEWVPKPGYIQNIKEEVHANSFILTRREAGIQNTKVYEVRGVRLGPEARRTYEKVRSDFLLQWKGKEIKNTKWIPVQYTWLQQIASGFAGEKLIDPCKVRALLELLEGELKNEQVVVWFRFNSGLVECAKSLRTARILYSTIHGAVSFSDRERAINNFFLGHVRILLCQIKCAKEAIDLSSSSTAIYFSNSHSLDERVQSEDRILSVRLPEPLLYLDLVAENTVYEDIVELLREKKVDSRFFLTRLLDKLKEQKGDQQNPLQIPKESRLQSLSRL